MAETSVETILTVPEVQLHEVLNGVESLKEWGPLLVSLHSFQGESGLWLKVGKIEWSVDPTTPTLEAAPNAYMFAMASGRFYSLLLAKGAPQEEAATLKEILLECTSFEHAGAMTKQHTEELVAEVAHDVETDQDIPLANNQQAGQSMTTADRITSGAATVQDKLMQSANWASRKILEQSQAYMEKHEATQNPVNVSPAFAKRVKMARKAAEMSSRAANRVAGGIADISVKMADSIIHHLGPSHYGEQLQDPQARPNAAKEIAAAAVLAATGVYDSMEQASRLVLNSGSQATSDFVGHKYGKAAGDVAKDAAHASVTAGMTVMTVEKIGLKKVARKIAKRTATGLAKKAVLGPPKPKPGGQVGGVNQIQASSGPGMVGRVQAGEVKQQQQQQAMPMRVSPGQLEYQSAPVECTEASYQSPFAN